MNIILIGPVYPYKGGISHYTGLMYRALSEKHNVTMISYKMQYPKLLFKKEQRDYSNDSFKVDETQFLINTANPFNLKSVASKINKMEADCVIFQWWHPYFAPCYYILSKLIRNKKIVFICHNVFPHERFPMDRLLCKMVLKQGDYFVVQSHLDEKDLLQVRPEAKYVVTPHPTYDVFNMSNMSKEAAREILKVEKGIPLLLFFGFVREYKGLKYLLRAMPQIVKQIPDIQLWVVGDFGDDRDEYFQMIEEYNLSKNIVVVEGYIPDQEVEKYFAATDLVVLPYISATQSGIVQIAYGFDKPVVVTNVGGLPDVVDHKQTGLIVEKECEEELAKAVLQFFEEDKAEFYTTKIKEKMEEFSWGTMVKRIEELVQKK